MNIREMIQTRMMKRAAIAVLVGTTAVTPVAATLSPVVTNAATSTATDNNSATSNDLTDADIIDMSKVGSLTIHKYDMTGAEAANVYKEGERIASGQKDSTLEEKMKKYAIEGVQFSYLRVGNIEQYSNTKAGDSKVNVVYEIPTELATILELKAEDAYDMTESTVANKCSNEGVLHYDSQQLHNALTAILEKDEVEAKNKLEDYLYDYGTQDSTTDQAVKGKTVNMPKTDKNGVSTATDLELGLYLIVETEVPEQVTNTVQPWFASLPFTDITDTDGKINGGNKWMYDMDVYPKNQSGGVTLDKSVRNAYSNTNDAADKNGSVQRGNDYVSSNESNSLVVFNEDTNAENKADSDANAYIANRGGYTKDGVNAGKDGAGYSTDFAYRDTTTASAGDVLDYILVSKLPHITSKATFLSEYTFNDILSAGLTYNKDVKIAFYNNKEDADANNTKNAILQWDLTSDTYAQKYADVTVQNQNKQWKDGSSELKVSLTEEGLNIINGKKAAEGLSDKYMVVYYTATVNSNESLVLGDNGNENDVALTWSRTSDSYYNTLEDRNYVYSYSIDLTKKFSDSKGDLSKVQFKLYNATDAYYVNAKLDEEKGVYYVTGKNVSKEDATTFTPTKEGKIVIYGLEADKYQVTEVATDNGYTLLKDQIVADIVSTDREINASVAGVTGMDEAAIDAIVAAYHGGIYDENGDLVTASKDEIFGTDASRPAVQDANGRTIGKTDMYVGEIKCATTTVDGVKADMKDHTYKKGEGTEELTSKDATVVLDVVNNKNFKLPNTGGLGTIVCTLAGAIAAAVGVLFVGKKDKKKA